MLRCEGLEVSYGRVDVLRGLDLSVERGEILAILGPNGSGKSTALKTLAGVVKMRGGRITHEGDDITSTTVAQRVERGITLVPQGRRLFGGMSIEDNLRLGAYSRRSDPDALAANIERWCSFFPVLAEKRSLRAGDLSGGEQQMVAVARGLMSEPSLLLLDEPSLGISPKISEQLAQMLPRLRDEIGLTVVLVEQNVALALSIADRVLILKGGRVAADAPPAEFTDRRRLAEVFFT